MRRYSSVQFANCVPIRNNSRELFRTPHLQMLNPGNVLALVELKSGRYFRARRKISRGKNKVRSFFARTANGPRSIDFGVWSERFFLFLDSSGIRIRTHVCALVEEKDRARLCRYLYRAMTMDDRTYIFPRASLVSGFKIAAKLRFGHERYVTSLG